MSTYPRKGIAMVLCAPSGTGKTTLARRMIARFPRLAFSVSCTTRQPRAGEVDGRDYKFIEKEEFERLKEQGHFAEWARVHNNYYGTPLAATNEILNEGRDLLFDIDVQGAAQLKASLPDACFVFVLPPSRQALEKRLRSRGTESERSLAVRLKNAEQELREAEWFDAWVINDDQDVAFDELCAVYHAAASCPRCRPGYLNDLIGQF